MIWKFFVLSLTLLAAKSYSQNVGIGTNSPTHKLTIFTANDYGWVHKNDQVWVGSFLNNNYAAISTLTNHPLYFGTAENINLSISTNGNVGIGNRSATARLHISNNSSLPSPSILLNDSATAFSGLIKFKNNSYAKGMYLAGFSQGPANVQQYLDIRTDSLWVATFKGDGRVGINNVDPQYLLDVSGDVNTTGLIRLNGNPGSAGQILVSGGIGSPSWQSQMNIYPALDRLMLDITSTAIPDALTYSVNFGTPIYNLNLSNFSVAANSFTVNSAGLYEIEGKISISSGGLVVPAGGAPFARINLQVTTGAIVTQYEQILERMDLFSTTNSSFQKTFTLRLPIHLQSGSVVEIKVQMSQYTSASSIPNVTGGFLGINKVN